MTSVLIRDQKWEDTETEEESWCNGEGDGRDWNDDSYKSKWLGLPEAGKG